MTFKASLQNNKTALWMWSALIASLVWLVSLAWHPINIDDAWNGEIAFWLSKGLAQLRGFGDHLGLGDQVFFYHKALIWQGALAIKIFGFVPEVLKSISTIYLLLIFLSLYFWQKKLQWPKATVYLTILLLVVSQVVFEFGYSFRAETMVAFLFLNATLTLLTFSSSRSAFVAGGLLGLAVVCHINSFIFGPAFLVLLALKKEYKRIWFFLLGCFVFFLPYFWDMHTLETLQSFQNQFFNHSGVTERKGLFLRLLNEQTRYFHTLREASISLLAFILVFNFKNLPKESRYILVTLFISALGLAIVAQSTTPRYLIYFLPLLYIVFGNLYFTKPQTKIMTCALALMIIANLHGDLEYINDRTKKLTTAEMTDLISEVPNGSSLTGPYEMVFATKDRVRFLTMDYFVLYVKGEDQAKKHQAFMKMNQEKGQSFLVSNTQWENLSGAKEYLTPDKCIREWCIYNLNAR